MAAPSDVRSGVGLRHINVFALDAEGFPAASTTQPYEGVQMSGAQAFTLNDSPATPITHLGDDRPFAQDVLPSDEPLTGEIRTAKIDDDLDVILTDQKSIAIGEALFYGLATDKKGFENQVAVLAYWQSQTTDESDSNFGKRVWESRLLPKTYVVPQAKGSEMRATTEQNYVLNPQFVVQYLWGVTFTEATEGFTRAQALRAVTNNKPKIVAWKGDGATTEFLFPTAFPAVSTDVVVVWDDGTLAAPDTTLTTSIEYTTAPVSTNILVAYYEVA